MGVDAVAVAGVDVPEGEVTGAERVVGVGAEVEVEADVDAGAAERGRRGVMERVMAWTLYISQLSALWTLKACLDGGIVNKPVKCPCEDEIVVGGELAQAGLELALVDETTGLVDDDEGEDGPVGSDLAIVSQQK